MDPTQMTVEPKADAKAAKAAVAAAPTGVAAQAATPAGGGITQAADDAFRAMALIRTYRVRGHLAADLDPLGLAQRDLPADITPEYHGFAGAALDRPIYSGANLVTGRKGVGWGK